MSATTAKATIANHDITRTPVTFAGARLVGYSEHPRMSEETTAFDAEVHIGGKMVGTVSNNGRGGAHMFRGASAEGAETFRAASESFPGIRDSSGGYTNDLLDTLALTASLAKDLSGRTVAFAPDVTAEEAVSTPEFPTYSLPSRLADDLDATLPFLMNETGATSLLYPARGKGYWLHTATR